MKAITLDQPYAALVADGRDKVITLPYLTTHRGTLAIHASQKPAADGIDLITATIPDTDLHDYLYSTVFVLGSVIAIADLVDCIQVPTGQYAWRLGSVVKVGPFAAGQGQDGLWDVDLELA